MKTKGLKLAAARVAFTAALLSPKKSSGKRVSWAFLTLPIESSAMLPSRGKVSVRGTLNGSPFRATLEPDGQGGHWMKVDRKLRAAAGARLGEVVSLEIEPAEVEPEPKVPPDLRKALAAASSKVREAWMDVTPAARRDWIFWIASAKKPETRARRIVNTCDMLAKGKRRPCCFDRSGMYARSLACPVADDMSHVHRIAEGHAT